MKRFKNILAVYGQEEAFDLMLERAAALAQRNGACLTLIEAVPGIPSGIPGSLLKASPQELHEQYVLERQKQLSQQIAPMMRSGLRYETTVRVGVPFIEIIKTVLQHQHDLVMMAAEGQEGLRSRIFGSTAMHMMRKCPCPVWVMKPSQRTNYTGIMAAVDPDPEDTVKHALNVKIMDLATSLSQQEQSMLHVVHAWSSVREAFLGYTRMPAAEIKHLQQELIMQRHRELSELIEGYSLRSIDSHVHFVVDEPNSVIPNLAEQEKIELIVMGTVCRTGLPGLLIGNTAENILGQVDCSILAVKPEGFVSPVELDDD